MARYRKALKENLPPAVRSLVERQAQGAQRNHDQIKAMRDACRAMDILFIADEVHPGFGRTGAPSSGFPAHGITPDNVTLVKDLKVKGTSETLKRGTMIKGIHLTDNEDEVECRHAKIKGLVLRTEFLKKA